MAIRAICINSKDRPSEIPSDKWPKEEKVYHITYVYFKPHQNLQAVELAEFDISEYFPYNSYKLQRFAIHKDDIEEFRELAKNCTDMTDMDFNKIIETIETIAD
tara:strand:+ start:161 stop:472 length:312 start_codon:yes stop_codon:yes gene_type:complete